MIIALLTSSYPRFRGDHQGIFIWNLARKLVQQNHEVHVICPHIPDTQFQEKMDGITIHRFPYFYPYRLQRLTSESGMYSAIGHSLLASFQIPFLLLGQFICAVKVIQRNNISLIHSHWLVPSGLVAATIHFFGGMPHIATVHGSDLHVLKKKVILRWLCRFILWNSTVITVNSNYMKQQLLSLSPEYEKNILIIPMGTDADPLCPVTGFDVKKRFNAEQIILNVGRLINWKGTGFLIKAMPEVLNKYPHAKLLIAGSGPNMDSLIRETIALGIHDHVEFLGKVTQRDLVMYYRSADVFVLPSVIHDGMTEGLGTVLLEAMACGCPVIGSNVGGISDIIVDEENGFLVSEKNSAAIAEKIITLLSDNDLAARFRKAGYETIGLYFSWDTISNKFLETYEQAIIPIIRV